MGAGPDLRLYLHVLTVGRVDGGGVAVPPQDDGRRQHVQGGVKLQRGGEKWVSGGGVRGVRGCEAAETYSESEGRGAVTHDGNSWNEEERRVTNASHTDARGFFRGGGVGGVVILFTCAADVRPPRLHLILPRRGDETTKDADR